MSIRNIEDLSHDFNRAGELFYWITKIELDSSSSFFERRRIQTIRRLFRRYEETSSLKDRTKLIAEIQKIDSGLVIDAKSIVRQHYGYHKDLERVVGFRRLAKDNLIDIIGYMDDLVSSMNYYKSINERNQQEKIPVETSIVSDYTDGLNSEKYKDLRRLPRLLELRGIVSKNKIPKLDDYNEACSIINNWFNMRAKKSDKKIADSLIELIDLRNKSVSSPIINDGDVKVLTEQVSKYAKYTALGKKDDCCDIVYSIINPISIAKHSIMKNVILSNAIREVTGFKKNSRDPFDYGSFSILISNDDSYEYMRRCVVLLSKELDIKEIVALEKSFSDTVIRDKSIESLGDFEKVELSRIESIFSEAIMMNSNYERLSTNDSKIKLIEKYIICAEYFKKMPSSLESKDQLYEMIEHLDDDNVKLKLRNKLDSVFNDIDFLNNSAKRH